MDYLLSGKIKNSIKEDLAIEDDINLNESLVAQEKQFKLITDFLSKRNLKNHKELYKQYVEDFNAISAKLDTADRSKVSSNHSDFRQLKIDETYNMNAAYLHELYFANIGDSNSEITMDSLSYIRLQRDFGTFDEWQRDFMACCQASRCGWAVTYLNTYTQKYMNCFIDLHSQNVPVGFHPVIVMDVWQHAYYRDYLKDVKTYTTAMMKELNWRIIEKRIEKADRVLAVIRG
jgi:Fe-Mn family superoxide dismutase